MAYSKIKDDLSYSTYLVQAGQPVNAANTNRPSLSLKEEINFLDAIIKTQEGTVFLDTVNAWNSTTTYSIGHGISYLGNNYISLVNNNLNIIPVNGANWKLQKTLDNRFILNYGTQSIIEVRPNGTNTRFLIQDTYTSVNGDFYVKTDDALSTRFTINNTGDTTVNLGNFVVTSGNIGTAAGTGLSLGYANTTGNIGLGGTLTSGIINIGSLSGTGSITIGLSTKTYTLNMGSGATENTLTKTVNIGTGGIAGSITNINFGSSLGTSSILLTGNATISSTLAINGGSLTSNNTTFNLLNTTVTTLNLAGAGTLINIGASTGTTAIKNNGTVAGTLVVTGSTTVNSTTDSTSKDSGSLVVEGGVGIEKNIYVGANANVVGNLITSGIATFNDTIKTMHSNIFVGSLISTSDAEQILFSINGTLYRSLEMFVQITQGVSYHSTKLLVIHDGTNAHITEFGSIMSSSILAVFRADMVSGNLVVFVDPMGSTNTTIKYHTTVMNN